MNETLVKPLDILTHGRTNGTQSNPTACNGANSGMLSRSVAK